jgi:O-antigen/teichoic acid export membrane protein
VLAGASGVASAYLYGRGTPGLNSLVLGAGLVVTVVLDVTLIPRYGALGAAVASTAAYLSTDALLIGLLLRLSTPAPRHRPAVPVGEGTP